MLKAILHVSKNQQCKCVEWNLKQIISVCDFANQNELLFTVFTVVHPHQQSTVKTLGEARIPFKKVLTSLQPQFELPVTTFLKMIISRFF